MRIICFSVLLCFFYSGISQVYINDTLLDNNSTHCWSIHIQNYIPDKTDKGDFDIYSTSLDNQCLHIKIGYGGGCGKVFAQMLADTTDVYANDTVRLFLKFDDNDYCKALVFRDIYFNIGSLRLKNKTPLKLKLTGVEETMILY